MLIRRWEYKVVWGLVCGLNTVQALAIVISGQELEIQFEVLVGEISLGRSRLLSSVVV